MLLIEGFLVGGCAGLVAVVYRRLLSWAEEAVMWISTQLRADLLWLPLVLVMLVLIGVGIAALLRWEPIDLRQRHSSDRRRGAGDDRSELEARDPLQDGGRHAGGARRFVTGAGRP